MSLRRLKRTKKRLQSAENPEVAQKFFDMANAQKDSGHMDKAVSLFKKALEHNPNLAQAHNNLANTLHLNGNFSEALSHYQKACSLLPDNSQIHANYGKALYESEQIDEAIEQFLFALNLDPYNCEALASIGVAYHAKGELQSAASSLQKAIELNPDDIKPHRFLGLVYKDQGKTSDALAKFSDALARDPSDALTNYLMSRYKKYSKSNKADIHSLLAHLAKPGLSVHDSIFFHFTLGKIYDDIGNYELAFSHYHQANEKKRSSLGHFRISSGIDLKNIQKTFTPELFNRFNAIGSNSQLPVFIIGMPRSGTSLIEQIYASHSKVYGAGELKMMRNLIGSLQSSRDSAKNYPQCLQTMQPRLLQQKAKDYINTLGQLAPEGTQRIIDKMPTNFIELGLIHILFPKAKIIHSVRNPLDTCLSNYFQNFEEGNEASFDLEELGHYYRKYQALMEFWRNILPIDIYEIQYEKLVANFKEEAQKLISFLGLEWQESCLTFFKTKRMIKTASDWQVRQPIYLQSIQRWKNYEPFLGPLQDSLRSKSKLI